MAAEFVFGPEPVEKFFSPSVAAEAKKTARIGALGPNTLRVAHTTPKVFFPFLFSELSFGIAGAVLPKNCFEGVSQDGSNDPAGGRRAFKLQDDKASERVLFERFDDYFNSGRAGA